jgi:hypothetical protein
MGYSKQKKITHISSDILDTFCLNIFYMKRNVFLTFRTVSCEVSFKMTAVQLL